jgi:hypothetical protein
MDRRATLLLGVQRPTRGRAGRWLLRLAAALVAVECAAQADPWASVSFVDPLRFNSLPLEGYEANAPAPAEWQVSLRSGYFNVWALSWHTLATHKEFGLRRRPLQPWEIRLLEQRYPTGQFFHIDLEGTLTRLVVERGLDGGIAWGFSVAAVDEGQPSWDAIAEEFHATLGLAQLGRDWFPRGQSTVVVRGRSGTIERYSGLTGSGLGDASAWLGGPAGRFLGAGQRWVVAVKAPTGERDTLRGSGGWDLAARWFATWGTDLRQVRLGLGYTRLDPAGSWLGIRRADMWHVLAETHLPLSRVLTFRASARFDSSPLAGFTDTLVGKPSFYWTVGVLAPAGRRAWLAFDAGENFPTNAEVPDYSIHLQVGARLGR